MPAPRKYPNELRDRAQRLVAEARLQEPGLSLNAAVLRIGPRVGVNPDTLRGWCKQAAIDAGERPGVSIADAAEIKALRSEVKELKRANEILLAASSFFASMSPGARPATAVVVEFIDAHRGPFPGRSAECSRSTACRSPRAATARSVAGRRPPGRRATAGSAPRSAGCTGTRATDAASTGCARSTPSWPVRAASRGGRSRGAWSSG